MKTAQVLNFFFKGEGKAGLLKRIDQEFESLPEKATYNVGVTGVAISEDGKTERPRPVRVRQSGGTYPPQSRPTVQECEELETQRRNLVRLLCRVLRSASGYKLRPSELAAETVGDLSFLSQETRVFLSLKYNLMIPSRFPKL